MFKSLKTPVVFLDNCLGYFFKWISPEAAIYLLFAIGFLLFQELLILGQLHKCGIFPYCVNFGSGVIYVQHVRKVYKK
jgi:hypothetical protein